MPLRRHSKKETTSMPFLLLPPSKAAPLPFKKISIELRIAQRTDSDRKRETSGGCAGADGHLQVSELLASLGG